MAFLLSLDPCLRGRGRERERERVSSEILKSRPSPHDGRDGRTEGPSYTVRQTKFGTNRTRHSKLASLCAEPLPFTRKKSLKNLEGDANFFPPKKIFSRASGAFAVEKTFFTDLLAESVGRSVRFYTREGAWAGHSTTQVGSTVEEGSPKQPPPPPRLFHS